MAKLLSVGLDVGTSTTSMILSELQVENRGSAFSVPELEISQRKILYESPVHFTPLLDESHVDGAALRKILSQEYKNAGITPQSVDTGAIIITGETSRKENARAVLEALEKMAGEAVVATAGPDLESVLAAKGAGANDLSQQEGRRVLHLDIGGGTSNLALLEDGKIQKTGCLNVGGRLLKFRKNGELSYISPVLGPIFSGKVGEVPRLSSLEALAETLVQALEMAAGLREKTALLQQLTTAESGSEGLEGGQIFSFSGGVAACMQTPAENQAFGDLGPILARAILKSRLCQGDYRLGQQTIRATVIGAGCHSTQLSGSTVFFRGIPFPLKNLPVLELTASQQESPQLPQLLQSRRRQFDSTPVISLPGLSAPHYAQIQTLADRIAAGWSGESLFLAMETDMAKALGVALALRTDAPILCIDRVRLPAGSYLDVGSPVESALPVVIKTLVLPKA